MFGVREVLLSVQDLRRYQEIARMQPLDTIVFETPIVRAARFRCDASDPRFRDCGPTANFAVVFPRTALWLRYSGARSFVADPSVATLYNRGQEYTRAEISPEGDRCEWFGVSPALALEIAASIDARALDRYDRPFLTEFARVDRDLYLAQRAFFTRLERKAVDVLDAEETIVGFVTAVLRRAFESNSSRLDTDNDARIDLVQRAKAALVKRIFQQTSLNDLATKLRVSPFYLCRVFREGTGTTLHEFKTDMRIRFALERLADREADLSRIALDCGFSSHSHFSASVRQRMGKPPSTIRDMLSV
jgi:AraC-like DNA-binding protein